MQFLPQNSENPEHLRHKKVLELARDTPYETPARWYRIHVDYIPALIALCDYYVHEDAHQGTPEEKELMSRYWVELQILLMTGTIEEGTQMTEGDDPFCLKIAQCLDSGSLDDTLAEYDARRDTGKNPDQLVPVPAYADRQLLAGCDADATYGVIKNMVDLYHRVNLDLLEILVASVNTLQLAELAISAMPIVGLLAFDEIAGLVIVLTENFRQNYMAF